MNSNKNLLQLLTPSWVTNFIGLTLGVITTGVVIALSHYQGSELRRQIFEVQAGNTTGASGSTYQNIATNVADNRFMAALPLLLVWAAVGLVVYYFAVAIAHMFGHAAEVRDELEYVHVTRNQLIKQELVQLVVRAAATLGWFAFIKVSLSVLLPYALASANIASGGLSLQNAGYAALAVVVIYVTVCVHAVFLRLIVLKTRLFGS